jgi:hypothetical protein
MHTDKYMNRSSDLPSHRNNYSCNLHIRHDYSSRRLMLYQVLGRLRRQLILYKNFRLRLYKQMLLLLVGDLL